MEGRIWGQILGLLEMLWHDVVGAVVVVMVVGWLAWVVYHNRPFRGPRR